VAPPSIPDGTAWTLVNAGLERAGAQAVLDVAADGTTVVGSVLTEDSPGNFDAGVVFSSDSGATWKWGGVVADDGSTYPEAVLLDKQGIVIVGSNQVDSPNGVTSRAFMARALAPDFVPEAVQLPAEFDGTGVQLQDIVDIDGEWVVAGYIEGEPDAKGKAHPSSALWRSDDRGASWSKEVMDVPDGKDVVVKELVVAPDGSWNAIGQVSNGDVFSQYDVMWLKSTDQGRTFKRMEDKALKADFDQGATRIVFSADGSAAILGWTEVSEDHGRDSALWLSVPGHGLSQIGTAGVPVEGSNPSGMFVDDLVWQDAALIAWGSIDGSYPMPDAQFWYLDRAKLVPVAVLPGNGTPLDVTRILPVADSLLAVGFTGADIDQADVGIWKAPLTAP
jgi:hypothetical protein